MNTEESVPNRTPIVITKEKLKMVGPPKNTSANKATNVVSEVSEVRLKVMLMAWLTISVYELLRMRSRSSRIRSKIMIVSLSFMKYDGAGS